MSLFTGTDLVCFRGGRTVFAGLGFALSPGEALMLRGPNGSGKSSLLRLMAGLGQPLEGALTWSDESIANDPEAHNARLHYIGHADPVKPVLTVTENLRFWATLRPGFGNGEDAIASALEKLGIGHLADVPGRFLSAGQKRRVNLARILAAPASLWLLDEPQTALDRAAEKNLKDAIADHRAGGGMVAISSHAENSLANARELDINQFRADSP
ncbi:MAG: heme ABC exporter ATP-binding protein CcmA [Rhodospirillales bacterium]|nr:heme ABC exporter ATP-binding protein CcmA [Alphaproteobacteria bacterium]MBL6947113.1 heme ABC exporter ATP-binding protein CcmA [Rhodospirillales bacterium]